MPIVGVKISMASLNPKRLLDGETPRLIDEWQIAPKLWDAVRFEADHRDALGQFVLTGSAVPPDTREITHSQATDYYDAVVHSDINRADGARKDPERVKRLMRSLARNQGQQIANTAIAADVAANDEATVNQETVASYIAALKKIFVVEDMPAWNPNLRSKSAIRTSDTRYFVDASIAAAALASITISPLIVPLSSARPKPFFASLPDAEISMLPLITLLPVTVTCTDS